MYKPAAYSQAQADGESAALSSVEHQTLKTCVPVKSLYNSKFWHYEHSIESQHWIVFKHSIVFMRTEMRSWVLKCVNEHWLVSKTLNGVYEHWIADTLMADSVENGTELPLEVTQSVSWTTASLYEIVSRKHASEVGGSRVTILRSTTEEPNRWPAHL